MKPAKVKKKLISVLREIQDASGLPCPPLTGEMKPIENIPQFDSKTWPVATTPMAFT